jgi:4-hydroxythreonine-4-phosphate dehydrogenase
MTAPAQHGPQSDGRPAIALTMGDPGGIGPELIAAILADPELLAKCRPIVVGDPEVIRTAASIREVDLEIVHVPSLDAAAFRAGRIDVLAPEGAAVGRHRWGELSVDSGRSALACLRAATTIEADGIVSAPVNKQALRLAGMDQVDELGLLADLTGSSSPALVGVLPPIWTICVTLHVPFRDIADSITRSSVLVTIRRLAAALRSTQDDPGIAVAGLNPHAGEGGHLGMEEVEQIRPAIEDARAEGIDAIGPVPADTLFPRALSDGTAGVVCMYHDQANIARKLHELRSQATLFLGLPVPVGTTAHGTAFDRAGDGSANADSLRAALDAVVGMAGGRR